jgi:N-acetylneuraminic acid mutarotase
MTTHEILAIGGTHHFGDCPMLKTCERYNATTKRWTAEAPLKRAHTAHGACILDGHVCVAGGVDPSSSSTNYVEYLDGNGWEYVESDTTMRARSGHSLCAVGGKMYAFGGYCEQTGNTLSTMDRYCDELKKLTKGTKGTKMLKPRQSFATCVHGGMIYAIGGATKNSNLATVDRYDPTADGWEELAPMPTKRFGCTAAVCEDCIYVIGGCNSKQADVEIEYEYFNTVENYDPKKNEWKTMAPLQEARFAPAACILNGRLCVIGGHGASPQHVNAMEVYDAANKTWKAEGGDFNQARYGMAVCALEEETDELQRRAAAARARVYRDAENVKKKKSGSASMKRKSPTKKKQSSPAKRRK